jgi:hypothetical protein
MQWDWDLLSRSWLAPGSILYLQDIIEGGKNFFISINYLLLIILCINSAASTIC